ncbi:heme o synthase [Lichenihabitans psoromatis]|uniref:heme o synthase n=1 Tax=Lichenihabitans psoromatis TaxID=2528642 RepID=UPI001035A46F|nr:heme o synthase [Lichenihabitans psoromatis]
MSLVSEVTPLDRDAYAGASTATPSDYLELLKPRVMSLVVFTALCGMAVAPGSINPVTGLASLLAIAVGAGASGALNMAYDSDIDAIMTRTKTRPIPQGRVSKQEANAFGLTLSLFSVMLLAISANYLSAALLAGTIVFYAVIYTMWLKRWTPQNIVIGGAAGAFPPMIGYAVVTGNVTIASVLLFAIIFIWTPPHFWALALLRSDDYARAGIPMMPNVKGPDRTRLEILLYTLVLAPVAVLPWAIGIGGTVYGVAAIVTGALMVHFAVQVYRKREGEAADKAAKHLFGFSILYLFVLFAILLAEHSLGLLSHLGW